jgi:hypothetical protein
MIRYLKQYGLKRSGTNITKVSLSAWFNTPVLTNEGSWKHGKHKIDLDRDGFSWSGDHNVRNSIICGRTDAQLTDIIKAYLAHEVAYVVTVREPRSWINSFLVYTGKNLTDKTVMAAIDMWNTMHRHWLDALASAQAVFITYENLVFNPAVVVAAIENTLQIHPITTSLATPRRFVGPGSAQMQHVFDGGAYRQKIDRIKYTAVQRRMITTHIDPKLMERFGYTKHE